MLLIQLQAAEAGHLIVQTDLLKIGREPHGAA
jgi:hypothetical protein